MLKTFALFIPFQTTSLLRWRKQALESKEQGTKNQDILPSWLNAKGVVFNTVFTIVIVLLDILFVSWMEGNDFADNLLSKVMGGLIYLHVCIVPYYVGTQYKSRY